MMVTKVFMMTMVTIIHVPVLRGASGSRSLDQDTLRDHHGGT